MDNPDSSSLLKEMVAQDMAEIILHNKNNKERLIQIRNDLVDMAIPFQYKSRLLYAISMLT